MKFLMKLKKQQQRNDQKKNKQTKNPRILLVQKVGKTNFLQQGPTETCNRSVISTYFRLNFGCQ